MKTLLSALFISTFSAIGTAMPSNTVLEARTFCAEKAITSFNAAYCVTFVNGEAIFTPKGGVLWYTPILKGHYTIEDNVVKISTDIPLLKEQMTINSDHLQSDRGSYIERVENPSIFYWTTDPQVQYVFIDASLLKETITISVDASEDCSPSLKKITIDPGSQKTYEMRFDCGRGYGTWVTYEAILDAQDYAISHIGLRSYEGKQLVCKTDRENSCVKSF